MSITIVTLIMAILISAMAGYIITDKTSAGGMKKALMDNTRLEADMEGLKTQLEPVTKENIFRTLVEIGIRARYDNDGDVMFSHLGVNYSILLDRLPMISVSKTYDLKDANLDWRLMKEAADHVTDSLVMVKFRVSEGESMDIYTVSYENNLASLKANLFRYLEILERASQDHGQYYQERMAGSDEQPDEQFPEVPKILS